MFLQIFVFSVFLLILLTHVRVCIALNQVSNQKNSINEKQITDHNQYFHIYLNYKTMYARIYNYNTNPQLVSHEQFFFILSLDGPWIASVSNSTSISVTVLLNLKMVNAVLIIFDKPIQKIS